MFTLNTPATGTLGFFEHHTLPLSIGFHALMLAVCRANGVRLLSDIHAPAAPKACALAELGCGGGGGAERP